MSSGYAYLGGLVALLVFVIAWELDAEFLQGIQDPASENYYNQPFFMRWCTNAGYSLFILFWAPIKIFKKRNDAPFSDLLNPLYLFTKEEAWIMIAGFIVSFPAFFTGWFWYLSVAHTSVTANTAVYDSSFIFVFLFSMVLLQERISLFKFLSCVVCTIGLFVVVFAGSQTEENGVDQTVMGYVFLIASTILFALYEVLFKKLAPPPERFRVSKALEYEKCTENMLTLNDEEAVEVKEAGDHDIPMENSFLFLGAMGLSVLFFYWPGIILVDVLGIETFLMPTWTQTGFIWLNIFLDGLLNISLFIGIAWTTPLFMGIGSLLNIPFSILFDILLHSYSLPLLGYVGISMIVAGFFLLLLADHLIANPKKGNFIYTIVYWSWGR